MTATTLTLTDFLLARIAEDAAAANAAAEEFGSAAEQDFGGFPVAVADFVERNDPARVLAECEAKRRIVELWRVTWSDAAFSPSQRLASTTMASVLEMLALQYADHEDFRDEWRP